MNLKTIGAVLIILCLMQISLGFVARHQINTLKLNYLPSSCHDGDDPNTCPVLKDNVDWYIAAIWASAFLTGLIGIYLSFVHKTTQKIKSENKFLLKKIDSISKEHDSDSRFQILLKGLDADEKKIMKEVYVKDGIGQNTLHIRTNISKSRLSSILTNLQKRNLIKKVPEGKINRIYLNQQI